MVFDQRRKLASGHIDEGQIGIAVPSPCRCADGDKDKLRTLDGFRQIGGESQPAKGEIALHQFVQPRLIDRHDAALQPDNLRGVLVDADDLVSPCRETRATDQSDISRSDDSDLHNRRAFPASSFHWRYSCASVD
ncbi:hypothetical protein D3C80_896160 [compost metagenome]